MPVDELAEHLARWQQASGTLDRARVAAGTTRTLARLSGGERTVLARALAERGVPQLASRVGPSASGGPPAEDVTRLARALLAVDDDQRAGLIDALTDPAHRARLASSSDARAAPPAWAPPPPPGATGPGAAARTPPPPAVPEEPEVEPVGELADDVPGHDVAPDEAAPDEVTSDDVAPDDVAPDEAAPDDVAPDEAAPDDGSGDPADAPSVAWDDIAELPTVARTDVTAAVRRLRTATTARERLAVIADLAGARIDDAGVVALLEQVPDGWQRRTLAKRLVASASPFDLDAAAVVASLGRSADRTAVAQALVGAGYAHVETVTDQLPPRAADRLRRRAARSR